LNLVAKEYIATRREGDGVVILSEFAGAAAELEGVILVNPYSPDDMDRALEAALAMPGPERAARMRRLRDRVLQYDVHRWSNSFLHDVERDSRGRRLVAAGGRGAPPSAPTDPPPPSPPGPAAVPPPRARARPPPAAGPAPGSRRPAPAEPPCVATSTTFTGTTFTAATTAPSSAPPLPPLDWSINPACPPLPLLVGMLA